MDGLLASPLVTFSDEGEVVDLQFKDAPDREPFTEFYSGVLVVHFREAYREAFSEMMQHPTTPLVDQLPIYIDTQSRTHVCISGLDYSTMTLTPQSRIRKI